MADPTVEHPAAAEDAVYELVQHLLFPGGPLHRFGMQSDWHVVKLSAGVGKSHVFLSTLARALREGTWPQIDGRDLRVLYTVDTIEQAKEKSEQYFGATWTMGREPAEDGDPEHDTPRWCWVPGDESPYWVREGRNSAPQSSGYCPSAQKAQEFGKNRHIAAMHVCGADGSDCQKNPAACKYTHSRAQAKEANFVIATKDSYFTGSHELREFDVVIADEDMVGHLFEEVRVSRPHLELWLQRHTAHEKANQYDPTNQVLGLFIHALMRAGDLAAARSEQGHALRAMPIVREAFAQVVPQGMDTPTFLQQVIDACSYLRSKGMDTAPYERPLANNPIVPLRATFDVARMIQEQWSWPEDADDAMRYHGGTLSLMLTKKEVVDHLSQAWAVVFLDATADLRSLSEFANAVNAQRPGQISLTVHDISVRSSVEVVQLYDGLYAKRVLERNDKLIARMVAETVGAFARKHEISREEVTVMLAKSLNPDANPDLDEVYREAFRGFQLGHRGKDDKATNRYLNTLLLASIGNYVPNIGVIEHRVEALRHSPASRPRLTSETKKAYRAIPYPGTKYAIERPVHPDPDVQAAIDHLVWSHETQMLGRMRAVRRQDQHLVWIRFNAHPYADMAVTTLVAHNDLRRELGLPKVSTLSRTRTDALHATNTERAQAANAKLNAAYDAFVAEHGTAPTQTQLVRITKVSSEVVKRFISGRTTSSYAPKPYTPLGVITDEITNITPIRPDPPTPLEIEGQQPASIAALSQVDAQVIREDENELLTPFTRRLRELVRAGVDETVAIHQILLERGALPPESVQLYPVPAVGRVQIPIARVAFMATGL